GMLRLLAWGGAALALLLIAGVAPAAVLLVLWIAYLSLSVAGQAFLWFQWDGLLLETGLLAVLYAASRPSTWMRWLLWWLLFRLMFLSGVTKKHEAEQQPPQRSEEHTSELQSRENLVC